jgi:fructose-1,6-bisphosphatase/inositol monophosphatase family enzyme
MKFTRQDLDRLSAIISDAAEREILPRFRQLGDGAVRQKTSHLDLVTDADEAADTAIAMGISQAFPQAAFIGEETVERDHSLLDGIAGADFAIIIDPIDGTSNFAWGLPLFGMLAAVTVKGETVAGLIYDPLGKDWVLGIRGEGAWHQDRNGRTRDISVADPVPVDRMIGVTSWYLMPEPMRSRVAANLARIEAPFAYRCAAYEYRLVALGQCHFSLHYKLMPWDHAAGVLIHSEAGGYSARYDGSPYKPSHLSGGLICAPDKPSWQALRAALLE